MSEQSRPGVAGDDALTWRTMTLPVRIATVVVWVVYALYLVLLLKLLFSRPIGSERSFNLIPFKTISSYLFTEAAGVKRFALANVAGNVVAFVPLGALLPLLRRRTGIWTNLLVVLGASVAVEVVQGVFGLGASDIDDVIANTLGGFLGVAFFTLLLVLVRRWSRVMAVTAGLSLLAVPVLCYLLFAVRLRL